MGTMAGGGMHLSISDDRMSDEDFPGVVAERGADGRWTITGRAGTYSRNQAITAMVLAHHYGQGHTAEHPTYGPHIQGWEAELSESDDSQ